jgi:hypothetical protein
VVLEEVIAEFGCAIIFNVMNYDCYETRWYSIHETLITMVVCIALCSSKRIDTLPTLA